MDPNEWTLTTVRYYLEHAIEELDKKLNERKAAQDQALAIAWQASKEALKELKEQAEAGFVKNNEWRGSINDVIASRIARSEVQQMVASLEDKMINAAARLDRMEGRTSGISSAWSAAIAVAAMLVALSGAVASILLELMHSSGGR